MLMLLVGYWLMLMLLATTTGKVCWCVSWLDNGLDTERPWPYIHREYSSCCDTLLTIELTDNSSVTCLCQFIIFMTILVCYTLHLYVLTDCSWQQVNNINISQLNMAIRNLWSLRGITIVPIVVSSTGVI